MWSDGRDTFPIKQSMTRSMPISWKINSNFALRGCPYCQIRQRPKIRAKILARRCFFCVLWCNLGAQRKIRGEPAHKPQHPPSAGANQELAYQVWSLKATPLRTLQLLFFLWAASLSCKWLHPSTAAQWKTTTFLASVEKVCARLGLSTTILKQPLIRYQVHMAVFTRLFISKHVNWLHWRKLWMCQKKKGYILFHFIFLVQ